jgi:glycosyltransferase involved in cell wall biosynthesis
MASGKAIIVSNKVGCAKDLVKNGINGWIFESNNQRNLKEIIEQIPKKETLKEMGKESNYLIKSWGLEYTSKYILKEWRNI